MITLYTWTTPNGRKVSIMLEEIGLAYETVAVNIGEDEQFDPKFLEISPNNKIPAIVDHDPDPALGPGGPLTMMESGAILLYLGRKTGQLIPEDPRQYWRMMEWLMLQMGSVGPMFGQVHHFVRYNQGKAPYAEERYLTEAKRIYGVLDKRLGDHEYLADAYSVADIATWPWVSRHNWQTIDLNDYPNVKRWYLAIAARSAVQKGYHVPKFVNEIPMPDDEAA